MAETSTNSRPQYASISLYVGDLSPDVSEATLYELFNSVGHVASIKVCRDASSRRSLRYAYVNYHSISDAERALESLNYTPIKGNPCRIMWSQRNPDVRKSNQGNLFVKNLDKGVDNRALHDTFSLFGNILSCKVVSDEQGRSKGYGFVHFESDEAAAAAVERVNGMKIGSKEVYVAPHLKRSDRPSGKTEFFTNLYVKNFPKTWTEDIIRNIFAPHGEITSIWLSSDSKGRPFACVNYNEAACAKQALLALNGVRVNAEGLIPEAKSKPTDTQPSTGEQGEEKKEEEKKDEEKEMEKEEDKKKEQEDNNQQKPPQTPEEQAPQSSSQLQDNKQATPNDSQQEQVTMNKQTDIITDGEDENDETGRTYVLYVDRAQDRSERHQNLRNRYDRTTPSGSGPSRNKFDGVNLYIKNLSEKVDDDALRAMFEQYGAITSAKVMRDEDQHSKGFGFVCFTTGEEATKAIAEMHLKLVDNKPLYVGLAEQKERRLARLQNHFRGTRLQQSHQQQQQQQQHYSPPNNPPPYAGPSPGSYYNTTPSTAGPLMAPGTWQANPSFPQPPHAGPPAGPNVMWKHPNTGYSAAVASGAAPSPYAQNPRSPPNHSPNQDGANPAMAKQILGEQLFPLIYLHQPTLAGKITGMMLDMDVSEIQVLLHSERELKAKINEALLVLEKAQQS